MLHLDEATHTYTWNGRVVPGVTSVLRPLVDLSMVPPDTLERARQEGVAIHKMVELALANDLDIGALPEWLKPRYAAWMKFCATTSFEPLASEIKLYHAGFGYGGKPDIVGIVGGKCSIIDIKRSLLAGPVIGLQLAAYLEAWNSGAPVAVRVKKRFALRLLDTGEPKLEPYEDPGDFTTFLSFLTAHKWCVAHKRTAQWTQ